MTAESGDSVFDRFESVMHVAPRGDARLSLTEEQESVLTRGENLAGDIVVRALAGAGKSTLQRAYADRFSGRSMYSLVFNRSLADHAKSRMPANVEAQTAHALAFRELTLPGKATAGLGDKLIEQHHPHHIAGYLGVPEYVDYAAMVLRHLHRFLISAVSSVADLRLSPDVEAMAAKLGRSAVADVQRLYDDMLSPTGKLRCTHDAYLKAYQLSAPSWPVDEVLCDEWQDANDVTLALVSSQAARKVYVGDPHQAIYGFRGSSNAMERLGVDQPYYLSRSFRFGPAVAEVANAILAFKGEKVRLVGAGAVDAVGEVDRHKPYAFISRTVGGVLSHAVSILDQRPNASLCFVGGVEGYRVSDLMDVYEISRGRSPENIAFARHSNLDTLTREAEATRQLQLLSVIRLVHRFGNRIPTVVASIRAAAVRKTDKADVTLTTAHRSKGLEFDAVVLDNNFVSLSELLEDLKLVGPAATSIDGLVRDPQEVNLLYVAATRAKHRLELNADLRLTLEGLKGAVLFGHRHIGKAVAAGTGPKRTSLMQGLMGEAGAGAAPGSLGTNPSTGNSDANGPKSGRGAMADLAFSSRTAMRP